MNVQIRPIDKVDAPAIARLHIDGIPTGFISSLGPRFVESLYESIAESDYSFGFVGHDGGRIVGFVTFTTGIGRLYRSTLRKRFFRFLPMLARKMFSLSTLRKMLGTLFYPMRTGRMQLPDAELLSIVVASTARRSGLGRSLIQAGLQDSRQRGIDKLKVLVAAENAGANQLYKRCGFQKADEICSHGVKSNIYTISL